MGSNDGSLAFRENGNTDSPPEVDEKQLPAEDAPPRAINGISWFLVVLATLSSIFMYALDNTIVADIVPAIVDRFSSVDKLPWLSVGFAIGGVAVVMPVGKLYTLFNAKWLYIGSVVIFMAASALCGVAPTMDAEIVGRVIAGAGGNGMYLGVVTLISVNTSNKERPMYLSLVGLIWGVGTVLGPVIGGALEHTWRWAFYLNLIVGGVFAPVYIFLLTPFDPAGSMPYRERFGKIDGTGAVLSIAAFTCLIIAINFGGVIWPWGSGRIIALFVVAFLLWIVFFAQQAFTLFTNAANRLFPLHLLRNKEAILIALLTATGGAAGFITIYYIPIYFQFARGDNGMEAAVRLLPLIFLLSFTILASGALMSKFGFYKAYYVFGSVISVIGGVLLSRIEADTSPSVVYGYEILMGIGVGAYAQAGFAVIQALVPPADVGSGITFAMIGQLGGIAFGLGIAGAAFLNDAQNNLLNLLPDLPLSDIQSLMSGTNGAVLQNLDDATRAAVLSVIVHALRKVFIPVYVASAVSVVASLFLRNKSLHVPTAAAS